MRHPLIEEVRAYWEALRGGGGIPRRAEVDPRGIERALEHAMILERIAPGIARIRLAGMGLADLMDMEVRGMPLSALFAPAARDRLAGRLEPVFAAPAVLEMSVAGEGGYGRPPLSGILQVLPPLRSNAGAIDRALACLVTEGRIGRTPRRLVIVGATLSRLDAPGAPARAVVATPASAAAHAPAPAHAHPRASPSRRRRRRARPAGRRCGWCATATDGPARRDASGAPGRAPASRRPRLATPARFLPAGRTGPRPPGGQRASRSGRARPPRGLSCTRSCRRRCCTSGRCRS